MKILITGGAGFVGTNTSLYLKRRGFSIMVLDNFSKKGSKVNANILIKNGVKIVRYDLKNKILANHFLAPDIIIHFAANGSTPRSIQQPYSDFLNTALTAVNILEYAKKKKLPVIYSSTCKVYSSELNIIPVMSTASRYVWDFSPQKTKNIRPATLAGVTKYGVNENFPVDSAGRFPHSPYGISHLTGDLYAQDYFHLYQVPTVINRMSAIYGPFQRSTEDQGWLAWMISKKINGEEFILSSNQKTVRDLLWIDDLAELLLLEINKINSISGQVFNIGGGLKNSLSLLEAKTILNSFPGHKFKFKKGNLRPADHKIFINDIRKVKNILNWKPKTKPEVGIKNLLDIYGKS